ncbi:MAG: TrmH family RNA methyltransferase [Gemmatimonadales bacterium]
MFRGRLSLNHGSATITGNLQSTVRDLQRRKARGRRGLALVEGVRLVEEALAAGLRFRGTLVSAELERTARGRELRTELGGRAIAVQEVGVRSFTELAGTDTPQGIIAVVEAPKWTADQFKLDTRPAVLVIDGVQDPGNAGTLIRTAHALGAAGTIVLRGTADILNPKCIRAAMGATFRHPVVAFDDNAFLAWARQHGVTLWAGAADGVPLHRALAAPGGGRGKGEGGRAGGGGGGGGGGDERIAVIVGNEGGGIRPQLTAVSAKRVAIPLAQGAESLNVAVAAGILLYEVLRGR